MNNELIPGRLYKMACSIRFVTIDVWRKHIFINSNQCCMFLYDIQFNYDMGHFGPHFLFGKDIVRPYWETWCDKQIYHEIYLPL